MSEQWYECVTAAERITQGDVIFDCPLLGWQFERPQLEGAAEEDVLRRSIAVLSGDVVVMTQACDLEYQKVDNVVPCPHYPLREHRQAWEEQMLRAGQKTTEKAWKRWCDDVREGFVWNLSRLNAGSADGVTIEHRIVDFHEVYTVPRRFLESLLERRGNRRLRLLPPYREHLSQAFARFFMRVGLPTPIEDPW